MTQTMRTAIDVTDRYLGGLYRSDRLGFLAAEAELGATDPLLTQHARDAFTAEAKRLRDEQLLAMQQEAPIAYPNANVLGEGPDKSIHPAPRWNVVGIVIIGALLEGALILACAIWRLM